MIKPLLSEDAVSEVVDYVTILGILVISIGIIGVAGYPMVKNAQEANYIENTKQSFIVLADNVNKVVLGQAPSQNVELKLYGGTLSANGSSTITVNFTIYNQSNNPPYDNITIYQQMRSIESTVGDTVIAYQGTGVWARYPNGYTLMVSKPLIANLSNMLVIPAVYISGTDSVGGSGMSRVVVDGVPGIIFYKNASNITVTVNSSYTGNYNTGGWANYLNKTMLWTIPIPGSCTPSSCTVQFPRNNTDVYILNIQLNTRIL